MNYTKELQIRQIENRIILLRSRVSENGNIIKKLERKLRRLRNEG